MMTYRELENYLSDFRQANFDARINELYKLAQETVRGGKYAGLDVNADDPRQVAAIVFELWKLDMGNGPHKIEMVKHERGR